MSYKLGTTGILILLLSLFLQDTLDAQRRTRSRTRSDDNTQSRRTREPAKQDLDTWYGFSLGTLGFGGSFSISGKAKYGLELKERFSVGLSAKAFYDLLTFQGPDVGLFSYGGTAFTRVKITDEIYLQGEYGYTDFEGLNGLGGPQFREGIFYPSVGGGYATGFGNWKYGFHVLLPLNDRAREFVSLEYWIDFVHSF